MEGWMEGLREEGKEGGKEREEGPAQLTCAALERFRDLGATSARSESHLSL